MKDEYSVVRFSGVLKFEKNGGENTAWEQMNFDQLIINGCRPVGNLLVVACIVKYTPGYTGCPIKVYTHQMSCT